MSLFLWSQWFNATWCAISCLSSFDKKILWHISCSVQASDSLFQCNHWSTFAAQPWDPVHRSKRQTDTDAYPSRCIHPCTLLQDRMFLKQCVLWTANSLASRMSKKSGFAAVDPTSLWNCHVPSLFLPVPGRSEQSHVWIILQFGSLDKLGYFEAWANLQI